MIDRYARKLILAALADTRVVYVMGPRQAGKTTLTSSIATEDYPARVITLDNHASRRAAELDPTGFVAGLRGPVVIDEVQHVPDLLLSIKEAVDRDTTPGRFLLTGSANIFSSRRVKDALTGRIQIIRLWPLSQAEVHGLQPNFVDALFNQAPPDITNAPVGRDAFVGIVAEGGFPEARLRTDDRRGEWFSSYVDTTLDSDLRDITDALKLQVMPRLLRLVGSQAANILVYKNISDRLDLHIDTVKSYIQLLESVFLVKTLPAWRPGIGLREIHAPKVYVVDSGLLAYLLAANEVRISGDDQVTGKLFENFVAMEVLRHLEWAKTDARLYHYRE